MRRKSTRFDEPAAEEAPFESTGSEAMEFDTGRA
jgi:hypothetical protein